MTNVEHNKTDKWHLSKCHSDLMLQRLLKKIRTDCWSLVVSHFVDMPFP